MHSLQWSGLYIFFSPSLHESGFKRVITCPWQFRDPKLKMLMNVDVRVPALEFTLKLKKEEKGTLRYQFISSKWVNLRHSYRMGRCHNYKAFRNGFVPILFWISTGSENIINLKSTPVNPWRAKATVIVFLQIPKNINSFKYGKCIS